jgi:hypothetical protein
MSVRDRKCVSLQVGGPAEISQWAGVWTYWTHVDDLKVGDWVIVEAPRNEHGQLVAGTGIPIVAQVMDINPNRQQCAKAKKWIVDRIDWDKYRALQALAPPEPEEAQ